MVKEILLIFFMFAMRTNMIVFAEETQVAYSLDNIECISSNQLSNTEACQRWTTGMRSHNLYHVICKSIKIIDQVDKNGLVCTPSIINHNDNIIYIKYYQLPNNELKVAVNYTGMSRYAEFICAMIPLVFLIGIVIMLCICGLPDIPDSPSHRSRNNGMSSFTTGFVTSRVLSGNSRRSTLRTGGWTVAH